MQFGKRPLYTPENVFIISDIHNEADKLKALIAKIEEQLGPNDHIVFSGDLVDVGPDMIGVLLIVAGLKAKYTGRVFAVRGNHEAMLISYMNGGVGMWLNYGRESVRQMKERFNLPESIWQGEMIVPPDVMKKAFVDNGLWGVIEDLIPYYETDKIIVTHAPLDMTITQLYGAHKEESRGDCLDRMASEIMWKFTFEQGHEIPWIPKFMVCGHQFHGGKAPRIFKYRCFLDIGCGYRKERPAVALHYPSKKVIYSS
jgi:hypothetical protein